MLLLLTFTFSACEDVIEVDLPSGEAKIVIDAEIVWQKGTDGSVQSIKISRMADYYNPTPPKVSGAEVYVENAAGEVFTFIEAAEPGLYICSNFVPELNGIYTLSVTVEGETYTATETLIPVSEINRVEQQVIQDIEGDNIEVAFYYDDPVNQANLYLTEFDTDVLPYPEYELTDDEFFNGNEIRNEISEEDLLPGVAVEITLRGVSRQFYNYMNLILETSSSNPFSTPSANIRGNVVSQGNSQSYALGYFRLCESDRVMYVIE